MLKRYLPLLFVVVVVLATAIGFLLLRDSRQPTETPEAETEASRAGSDGVPEYRVESEQEYELALASMGTSTEEIEDWARSRGFPPATYTNTPGTPLQRSYRREKVDTLLGLAQDGDHWAMQFLAAKIAPDQPLEAVRWYRQAVVHGSAHAAFKLGSLYRDVAVWLQTDSGGRDDVVAIAEQEDPLAYTALAWLLVAEYDAGLPPGSMSSTLTRFHEADDEGILESCRRAARFLAEVSAEREALGIQVAQRRPPLAIELPPEETVGYCPPEIFPRVDFSDCQTVRVFGDAGSVAGHRCTE